MQERGTKNPESKWCFCTTLLYNSISTRTKLRIFRSNVKSVLLYGSETWKVAKTTTQSYKYSLIAVYEES